MQLMLRYICLCLCLAWGLKSSLWAQDLNCAEVLIGAQEAFDRGDPFTMPEILEEQCLEEFNWLQKVQFYRLLTLSYLFQEEEALARESMQALLKLDPEYPFRKDDPVEWRNLYNDLNPRPYMALKAQLGANGSFMQDLNTYATDNTLEPNRNISRSPGLGYQIALGADFFLRSRQDKGIPGIQRIKWELGTEVSFQQNAYRFRHTAPLSTLSQTNARFAELSFREVQQWFTGSIWLRYNITSSSLRVGKTGKIFPFAYAGLTGFMSSYIRVDELSRITLGPNGQQSAASITDPSVVVLNQGQRERYNIGLPIGVGLAYKRRIHYFQFDFRTNIGLTNIVNPQNRYYRGPMLYRFGYVDSDLSLNLLTISFSYRYAFYKTN